MDDDEPGQPEEIEPEIRRSNVPRLISRREMLAAGGGLLAGGLLVGTGAVIVGGRSRRDPFAVTYLDVGDAAALERQAREDGPVMLDQDAPPVAIVHWDPSVRQRGVSAADVYGPQGEGHPVLAARSGLMALVLLSTHRGCRVPFCHSSGWFEDPCHGAKWNAWGEWTAGPAPRGLDRLASTVEEGRLVLHLSPVGRITGPRREARLLESEPRGPSCVEG